ncbi:MAG: glycine cleavage system protein GcvH [Actinomycetota bacterium]|nr:glycine cleavage system protein H [Acidimicrobiaceae bacterium]MEC7916344.1 glycine cleavage system protein GcvH [Actinomycetota bacterium]MED5361584.1 glycine cleavage system protein GcvH [Actinomycetota bacterium]
MNTPPELRYSKDHEWVRVEGDVVRVGITDFAQDALGDVVYVELPETGLEVEANAAFAEIESTKSVSDIFAPVSGEVVEANIALEDQPELVNEDPYGDGWVCAIRPSIEGEIQALMDAEGYQSLVAEESQE